MSAHARPEPSSSKRPIDVLVAPARDLMAQPAASGIVLLTCTLAALIWANSPWSTSYHHFWHAPVTLAAGGMELSKSLAHWVNDGLMAVFFFVVGLEIKRELLVGELASPRKAAIPIAAAAGGMIAPAAIYALFNLGGAGAAGWAIPSATDIAFAIGVLALLGPRVPLGLKVFLTALAIVDDIGAVLVIAIFYTSELSFGALGVAGIALASMIVANVLQVRSPVVYAIFGFVLWVAFLESGIHATIAGVLGAFTIPAISRIDGARFVEFSRTAIDEFERLGEEDPNLLKSARRQNWVYALETGCEQVQAPLQRLEHGLHGWVSFFVMPVFALANAGVSLGAGLGSALTSRVALGVALGLIVGKQVGVLGATWLATRIGLGTLPAGTDWKQIYAAGWIAGIGFTMSLFIANLGFGEGELLEQSKVGILAGSIVAGVVGALLLRRATRRTEPRQSPSDS